MVCPNCGHTGERDNILVEVKKYFDVRELVCPHTYDKWGVRSWQFLDTEYLATLLVIRRDILKSPMLCNDGSKYTQRGLRCNRCELVRSKSSVYLSSHILGKAGDFTVQGMTAQEARDRIKANADKLPCNIRLEEGVSWLHFDVLPQYLNKLKVYSFTE